METVYYASLYVEQQVGGRFSAVIEVSLLLL